MKLLLHICCANCAIYPAKTLREEGHNLTGFWFNPNIHPYQEYKLRLDSLKGLADRWLIDMYYLEEYKPTDFFKLQSNFPANMSNASVGNSSDTTSFPQSPERCKSCYRLRLKKTAEEASKQGFDAFTTTLLISPYQNFEQITTIGNEFADKYNISFYLRDFRPHFRKPVVIAKELGLYRQKYCGCIYSREERKKENKSS